MIPKVLGVDTSVALMVADSGPLFDVTSNGPEKNSPATILFNAKLL